MLAFCQVNVLNEYDDDDDDDDDWSSHAQPLGQLQWRHHHPQCLQNGQNNQPSENP